MNLVSGSVNEMKILTTNLDSTNIESYEGMVGIKTWVFDPPYNIKYNYNNSFDDNKSEKDYKDFILKTCQTMHDFSSQHANMFFIIYPQIISKFIVDIENIGWKFKQWITWVYPSNIGMSNKKCTTASRAIVWFTIGEPLTYMKAVQQPYKNPKDKRIKMQISNGSKGVNLYDWWHINLRKNVSKGFKGYYNQLPYELVNRIILLTTKTGDKVGDLTAGAGTTLEVSKQLIRDCWINDLNKECLNIWSEIK